MLFKHYACHGLVDKLLIIMFSETDQTGMISQRRHGFQIGIEIVFLCKEQITENTVDGKDSGYMLEVPESSAE